MVLQASQDHEARARITRACSRQRTRMTSIAFCPNAKSFAPVAAPMAGHREHLPPVLMM